MASDRPRQQQMMMDGNRTNLHGKVFDIPKFVMLEPGIRAKSTTRRTSTWNRDMEVQRMIEALVPYYVHGGRMRGSRSNPWDPTP